MGICDVSAIAAHFSIHASNGGFASPRPDGRPSAPRMALRTLPHAAPTGGGFGIVTPSRVRGRSLLRASAVQTSAIACDDSVWYLGRVASVFAVVSKKVFESDARVGGKVVGLG